MRNEDKLVTGARTSGVVVCHEPVTTDSTSPNPVTNEH
jgi:hypothetical protein